MRHLVQIRPPANNIVTVAVAYTRRGCRWCCCCWMGSRKCAGGNAATVVACCKYVRCRIKSAVGTVEPTAATMTVGARVCDSRRGLGFGCHSIYVFLYLCLLPQLSSAIH